MEYRVRKRFPANPKDYRLYEEIGEGVSAIVYRALCIPLNEMVAIKVLDLDKCNNDLDGIRREVQIMNLINHPNVLCAHCSFTSDHSLWIVMPYMAGGSCLHIMKSAFPEGFKEAVMAAFLHEVLKALVYLHGHGLIHRDVKAGNILVDAKGAVKLADFGVLACMFDSGDRQRSRNTLVGSPCWMAPEVIQQLHGYDSKADIWSFGITALELAHGHAPFSKYPPMKVLLMILQNAPPGFDCERDKRFSKSFKDMVAACLVKDPKKRPSAEKLLKHRFFKHACSTDYLVQYILDGLDPLVDRFRELKGKEANLVLENKALFGDIPKQECICGISTWNFNQGDLKAQAALIESSNEAFKSNSIGGGHKLEHKNNNAEFVSQNFSLRCDESSNFLPQNPSCEKIDCNNELISTETIASTQSQDEVQDLWDWGGPFSSAFLVRPLGALKTSFDVCEDENTSCPNSKESLQSSENQDISISVPKNPHVQGQNGFSSGPILSEPILSPYWNSRDAERDSVPSICHHARNYSGSVLHRQLRNSQNLSFVNMPVESSAGRVIQRGRFKVTSEDGGPKISASTNLTITPAAGTSASPMVDISSVLPSLHFLFQQNAMQREQLIYLIKCVQQNSGNHAELSDTSINYLSKLPSALNNEMQLHAYAVQLQLRLGILTEELERLKIKNTQLEQQINDLTTKRSKGYTKRSKG